MKLFRQGIISALLTLCVFGIIAYTACKKDPCKNVACNHGGTCSSGNCYCASGYEGTNCENAVNAKFIGNWLVTAACQASYVAAITADPISPSQIYISNFASTGTATSILASIQSSNIVTIANQRVKGITNTSVSGGGSLSGGVFSLSYKVVVTDTVTSTNTTYTCDTTRWVMQ